LLLCVELNLAIRLASDTTEE